MIKKIIFKKTDSLGGELVEVSFDKKVNVIIGPKGGGKSTLFDLVASLEQGKFPKKVKDALAGYGLAFEKAIKFNNEEITVNSLSPITTKELKDSFTIRNDVIYQDDPIKKELHNVKQIEKDKLLFATEVVDESRAVRNLISNLQDLHRGFQSLSAFNESGINWSNLFMMDGSTDSANELILNLNYSANEAISRANKKDDYLSEVSKANRAYVKDMSKFMENEIDLNDISANYKKELDKYIALQIKNAKELDKHLVSGTNQLVKQKYAFSDFQTAYKSVVDEIKQTDFAKSGIKSFEITSLDHFKNLAIKIKELKVLFDSLVNTPIELKFDKKKVESGGFMSFELVKTVTLTEDNIYTLMKSIFNTPKKSVSELSMWLDLVISKGVKEFDEKRLIKAIGQIIKTEVDIMANGMNYEHMSLGQKSIYGIEYKFRQSNDKPMFLDQPEDNLDNFTIAEDVLRLIDNRDKQLFIVTHNANIGLLSNPGKVIVANLDDEENQYSEGTIVKSKEEDSDGAHYLEGGSTQLSKRYKLIKGEK